MATNALELGIDIGGLGAAILVGYPGTVASARQQAGRAGRGLESAVAVMVASASPIDQFLAHHPEYFFERSPEQALGQPRSFVDPAGAFALCNVRAAISKKVKALAGYRANNLKSI